MDLKGPQHMGRRAGQTRRLAMGCPLTPHRVLSIELVSTREPRGSGTEGPGGDGEGPAAPPCPKSPRVGGRTGWKYIRMVPVFF